MPQRHFSVTCLSYRQLTGTVATPIKRRFNGLWQRTTRDVRARHAGSAPRKPKLTTFTPSEIALLHHRLEVWDAITEVIANDDNEELAAIAATDPAHVHIATLQLMGLMGMGRPIDEIVSITNENPLHAAVLRNAVEGSTYVCAIPSDDPETASARRAAIRAARSLTTKLRAAGFACGDVPLT